MDQNNPGLHKNDPDPNQTIWIIIKIIRVRIKTIRVRIKMIWIKTAIKNKSDITFLVPDPPPPQEFSD